jgi:hypothetical protein
MLQRVIDAGLPAGWLTADVVSGQDKRLAGVVRAARAALRAGHPQQRHRGHHRLAPAPSARADHRAARGGLGSAVSRRRRARAAPLRLGPIELLDGFDPSWAR